MKLTKMKRKYADRRGWRRIISSHLSKKEFMWPTFHGEAVLIHFDAVKAPLSVFYGGTRTKTVDRDYSWLQLFPSGAAQYVVTAMFDEKRQLVQCYFDVIARKGKDSAAILWFDDLYLDLILFPNHDLYLVDQDELTEALDEGIIDQEKYAQAWQTAKHLKRFIETHPDFFLDLARNLRATFPE